jgi:hypothetical protein
MSIARELRLLADRSEDRAIGAKVAAFANVVDDMERGIQADAEPIPGRMTLPTFPDDDMAGRAVDV